jgi:multicomponent Na+:H+ antiporter subunit D
MDAGESFTFVMGRFAAPFGNELKVGPLQALLSTCFSIVIALSLLGGWSDLKHDVAPDKLNLYFVMTSLTLAALYVLTYTNDMFTGYVFIEISTLSACALVMAKDRGPTLVATLRYLFLSLLGSGLFLIGVVLLYSVTGHLLMKQVAEQVAILRATGQFALQLAFIIGLFVAGLGVKSAMFPFHRWLPAAPSSPTPASSAILSGTVIKGTVIRLIILFCRVFTLETVNALHVDNIVFVLGIMGMIFGSVSAIRERQSKRMLAWSSIAQMGYIFTGIGVGTNAGIAAACFHILVHAFSKSMLFCCVGRLSAVNGHKKMLKEMHGTARRDVLAGIGFTLGALSMIGIPLLAGFASKLYLATSTMDSANKTVSTLLALALSTVLNALYYIPAIVTVWASPDDELVGRAPRDRIFAVSAAISIAAVILLGVAYTPVMHIIETGLSLL